MIAKSNKLLISTQGKRSSPYLLSKIAYIGQLDSYAKGSEIATNLLNISVSASNIYRTTDSLGEQAADWLEEEDLRDDFSDASQVYVQMDGSMLLTREESWKEVKLGRIFGSSSLHNLTKERNWLKYSEYVANFDGHKDFKTDLSQAIAPYVSLNEELVFINDGARWQWNWIEEFYPQSTQILDFYHVMEHIGEFVSLLDLEHKSVFLDSIANCLKEQGIQTTWQKIDRLCCVNERQKKGKKQLKTYIDNNESRMDYPSYLQRNLLIGSGAIESAHRTVIQRRMKLSGQIWSKQGAKKMLNLRVLNLSGHWGRVEEYYKNAA